MRTHPAKARQKPIAPPFVCHLVPTSFRALGDIVAEGRSSKNSQSYVSGQRLKGVGIWLAQGHAPH